MKEMLKFGGFEFRLPLRNIHNKQVENNMRSLLSVLLLIAGGVLLYFGVQASNSLGSEIKEFFTNSPSNRAIWFLLTGTILAIAGLFSLLTNGARQAA